jgi:hypothetical protein
MYEENTKETVKCKVRSQFTCEISALKELGRREENKEM